jgi:hypothetical protein
LSELGGLSGISNVTLAQSKQETGKTLFFSIAFANMAAFISVLFHDSASGCTTVMLIEEKALCLS